MKFNKLLLLLSLLTSSLTLFSQDKINWISLEEAEAKFKKEPKKIFVDVYTNWCGWCKKMDKGTFTDSRIIEYMNENFYAVKLNAESKDTINFRGRTLVNPNPDSRRSTHQAATLGTVNGRLSYPTLVVLDEGEQRHYPIPGYKQPNDLYKILVYFNEDYHKKMKWQEFNKDFENIVQE